MTKVKGIDGRRTRCIKHKYGRRTKDDEPRKVEPDGIGRNVSISVAETLERKSTEDGRKCTRTTQKRTGDDMGV